MRRSCFFALVLLGALVAAMPALAAPHLSKSQSREVSTLVNRFVNDLVLRRNLADGWAISGPDERGALTRKEWMSGNQVPVQQFDVLNDPHKAWYATWRTRTEIGLVVSLKTGHGKHAVMYAEQTTLEKQHGRWVVDGFYTNGIFRYGGKHSGSCVSSKCKVTGPADYAPGGPGDVVAAKPRISGHWVLIILFGILSLPVLGLAAFWAVSHRRDRRARASYLASRSR
jgi:hypothetical protein